MVKIFAAFLTIFVLHSIASAADHSSHSLFARQTLSPDQLPANCVSQCTTISNTIVACPNLACICTQVNSDALSACVGCVVSSDPGSSISEQAESLLSQFYETCATGGFPVSTIPNGGSSGPRTTYSALPSTGTPTFAPVTNLPTTTQATNPFAKSGGMTVARSAVWSIVVGALVVALGMGVVVVG